LRLQYMPERFEDLVVQGGVLTLEVQRRHGRRNSDSFGGGRHRRVSWVEHPNMVAATQRIVTPGRDSLFGDLRGVMAELKRLGNLAIVDSLRDQVEPGIPAPPRVFVFSRLQEICRHFTKSGKREIGTWKTSRHRIFRTPS
jgi:hypothetical protein